MLKALRAELRSVKDLVQTLVAPPSGADPALEGAVDSLRRLLSEVIEQRMEGLVRDLVDLRSEAAAIADGAVLPIVQRVDQLLDTLGAIRFHAEPMDLVDPLIHVVLEEWQRDNVPEGVVLETIRPGFRTARGRVLCKAAVAVNKRT
jgi:molecular chaperone GrpE (heat shock protein)